MPLIIWIAWLALHVLSCQPKTNLHHQHPGSATTPKLTVGAGRFKEYLPLLQGKRVALVVNQTSRVGKKHLVDSLLALGIEIKTIFAPEHGFRGTADAGEHLTNGVDKKTGLPIVSLYGAHRKPSHQDLQDIDVVVFDIQDVGARFYTYISTMHYVMESCARENKLFIVLDRPNPNGHYVAGPVLEMAYQSFVGMHPIPIVHGLTVGELATMINGEHWLPDHLTCPLKVVKVQGYTHQTLYTLPVKPSPNLPNQRAVLLYPSLCLLEPTQLSIGRGTPFPFQVIGYPDSSYGTFSFTPVSMPGSARHPKHQNKKCYGVDLRLKPTETTFSLKWLVEFYQKNPTDSFFTSPSFFDKLAGNSSLRKKILQGASMEQIEVGWKPKLEQYKAMRRKYLLYTDTP